MTILFVCKGNIGRSQMAQTFFADFSSYNRAVSAGTHVAVELEGHSISSATKKVIACMKEAGFDVSDNTMRQLTPKMVEDADKVIAITTEENLPHYLKKSGKLEIWEIPDAGGKDYNFHVQVREKVKAKVRNLVIRLESERKSSGTSPTK